MGETQTSGLARDFLPGEVAMAEPSTGSPRFRFDECLRVDERRCQQEKEALGWRRRRQLLVGCFDSGRRRHRHLVVLWLE